MDDTTSSLFDALVNGMRRGPLWRTTVIVAVLFVVPFAIALLDVPLSTVLEDGGWRVLVLQPAIVVYILAVVPFFGRSDDRIVDNIRPITQLPDHEFRQIVADACQSNPRSEWLSFGAGVIAGFVVTGKPTAPQPIQIYLLIAFLVMYGMMGWVVYKAFVSSRLGRELVRQPLNVNLFDIAPFEPIGRQSLLLSMAFVGGTIISLLFAFSWETILRWQFLAIYGTLSVISVLVFFVNMWPTHRLLSQTKQRHLANAAQQLAGAYAELTVPNVQNESTLTLYTRINAWTAMENRLKLTRTWPYDTEMLRTLFITILTPIAVALARIIAVLLTSGRP